MLRPETLFPPGSPPTDTFLVPQLKAAKVSVTWSKKVTNGFLCRFATNLSTVWFDSQTSVSGNMQLVPHHTGVPLSELAINWRLFRAHGLVELACMAAPDEAGAACAVALLQALLTCSWRTTVASLANRK